MTRPRKRIAISAVLASSALLGIAPSASAQSVVVDEFRFRGPASAADEFIELKNTTDTAQDISGHRVLALQGSGNASNLLATIPPGTTLAARDSYLLAPSGYTLAGYGVPPEATRDQTYTTNISDNAGVGLFAPLPSTPGSGPCDTNGTTSAAAPAGRIDAAAFTGAGTQRQCYTEGNAIPAIPTTAGEIALVRRVANGRPQDSNDNAGDFRLVATAGTAFSSAAVLGAPGPEARLAPNQSNDTFPASLIFAGSASDRPNRDFTTGGGGQGELTIRRRFTNNTGSAVSRLRFRLIRVSTQGSGTGSADLRAIDSPDETVSGRPVGGTQVEDSPPAQPKGGGLNSTFALTTPQPVASGDSVDVQFRFRAESLGSYTVRFNVESR